MPTKEEKNLPSWKRLQEFCDETGWGITTTSAIGAIGTKGRAYVKDLDNKTTAQFYISRQEILSRIGVLKCTPVHLDFYDQFCSSGKSKHYQAVCWLFVLNNKIHLAISMRQSGIYALSRVTKLDDTKESLESYWKSFSLIEDYVAEKKNILKEPKNFSDILYNILIEIGFNDAKIRKGLHKSILVKYGNLELIFDSRDGIRFEVFFMANEHRIGVIELGAPNSLELAKNALGFLKTVSKNPSSLVKGFNQS